MGMDRPGIEPRYSRMLSGCHATTPTAPELRRPRVLNYLLGTAFSAEALSRSPFALFSSYLLPAHSFGWCSLWANECGLEKRSSTCRAQFSALKLCHGPPVRPFFFLSAAGALLWLVLAVGKRVRARPFGLFSSLLLPAHSFGFFPFPFCRRTPLVGARCGQSSAAWKSAGSEAFVAGRSLWTDSLTAYWTQTRR